LFKPLLESDRVGRSSSPATSQHTFPLSITPNPLAQGAGRAADYGDGARHVRRAPFGSPRRQPEIRPVLGTSFDASRDADEPARHGRDDLLAVRATAPALDHGEAPVTSSAPSM